MKFYPSSLERSVRSFCPFAVNTDVRLKGQRMIMGATASSLLVSSRLVVRSARLQCSCWSDWCSIRLRASHFDTQKARKCIFLHLDPSAPFCPLCLKAPRGSGKIPSFLHAARPNQSVTSRLHRLSRGWNIFFYSASKTADNCDRLQGVSAS